MPYALFEDDRSSARNSLPRKRFGLTPKRPALLMLSLGRQFWRTGTPFSRASQMMRPASLSRRRRCHELSDPRPLCGLWTRHSYQSANCPFAAKWYESATSFRRKTGCGLDRQLVGHAGR